MTDPSIHPDIPALPTRLTRAYGLRHPFVGAGMGFIAHEQLAAAVTNAGGLGVLGASPDPPGSLPVMVERLRALTSGPFGVDLFHPLVRVVATDGREAAWRCLSRVMIIASTLASSGPISSTFLTALGGHDLQQRNDFARVGKLILNYGHLRELP